MPGKNKKFFGQKAQSIIELSLLGAALLGILGLLVSYAISLANSQETQLKAMRAAMKLSADESAKISQYGFLKPQGGNYYGSTTEPGYKSGHRKSAAVLVIEDKLTVQGGDKYGSTSLTPTISFGSGTVTNLLQYPMRYGDPSQLPYLDMYINGQHFAFTTSGYKYQHFGTDFCNQNFSGQLPRCLNNVPVFNGTDMWFWEGGEPKMPVAWTKIPRTDKRFCYGPNDPASHRCNRPNEGGSAYAGPYSERFRLDPLNGTVITDIAERKKLQWQ